MITLDTIAHLTADRFGTFDVPCPECGPIKSSRGQRRKTLRIWRTEPGFATYHCARCGLRGHTRDHASRPPEPANLARARAEASERDRIHKAERLGKARWLWSIRKPIAGSIAETYLRSARGYGGPLPATLGFLPSRGDHHPAMIAAFGMATESEPGVLQIADDAVRGVHLTRLKTDGGCKAGTDCDKIMIGHSMGSPITLAPPNDLLGMAITEGIEDGLSGYEALGLGVWAAGSAARMPALAEQVPSYIECVTVLADDDKDGRRFAIELSAKLKPRIPEVRTIIAASVSLPRSAA